MTSVFQKKCQYLSLNDVSGVADDAARVELFVGRTRMVFKIRRPIIQDERRPK